MSSDHSFPPAIVRTVLYIKHVVCPRGIRVVRHELESLGLRVLHVRLGAATVAGPVQAQDWPRIRQALAAAGFALLENPQQVLVTQVRQLVPELLRRRPALRHRDFVAVLAQQVGVSVRRLHSLFARLPGSGSLLSYVKHQRLTYAQELLGASSVGIGHIARQLGFSSLAHFSGQFRQFARCAPSAYRQQVRTAAATANPPAEPPKSTA
ncbi:helix-turn-helix transcriptional regulator [Hymenobacter rubripertinctus]|uniref:AraC family transcriptional regulator n=1 Tax=Hymenobacter rubripertinctus TaxID=2029981 RepID=A0A418QNP0_9BACT|nr:helix-turn-helix transcriptional regulator [Hymenobacter rubripertinctus]RIY06752.1 AraC family transcriptional regulator [Hymenobacter rubripertinctus]